MQRTLLCNHARSKCLSIYGMVIPGLYLHMKASIYQPVSDMKKYVDNCENSRGISAPRHEEFRRLFYARRPTPV